MASVTLLVKTSDEYARVEHLLQVRAACPLHPPRVARCRQHSRTSSPLAPLSNAMISPLTFSLRAALNRFPLRSARRASCRRAAPP